MTGQRTTAESEIAAIDTIETVTAHDVIDHPETAIGTGIVRVGAIATITATDQTGPAHGETEAAIRTVGGTAIVAEAAVEVMVARIETDAKYDALLAHRVDSLVA